MEISILNQYFSFAGLREWSLWLEMIDSLIIHFRRFDWMNAVSGKVLTSLKTALGQFEAIKFGQDLSQVKQDPFARPQGQSQVHLKSSVRAHLLT